MFWNSWEARRARVEWRGGAGRRLQKGLVSSHNERRLALGNQSLRGGRKTQLPRWVWVPQCSCLGLLVLSSSATSYLTGWTSSQPSCNWIRCSMDAYWVGSQGPQMWSLVYKSVFGLPTDVLKLQLFRSDFKSGWSFPSDAGSLKMWWYESVERQAFLLGKETPREALDLESTSGVFVASSVSPRGLATRRPTAFHEQVLSCGVWWLST